MARDYRMAAAKATGLEGGYAIVTDLHSGSSPGSRNLNHNRLVAGSSTHRAKLS
jgi:hypothetical protein